MILRFSTPLMGVLLSSLLFTSCITFHELDIRDVSGFKVNQMNKDGIEVSLKARINNPNNFKIKVKKADLDLFLAGSDIGKAKLKRKVVIPKRSDEEHEFIITSDFKSVGKSSLSAVIKGALTGNVKVRAKGYIKGKVFGIGKKYRIDREEKIGLGSLKL